ncbi:PREDICTED: dynactin subunit 4 [Rhagoletis zephyria]|uniref:dynactin subunit 4 n=1 Tax=Rhagoletis zephyria TaxID=28612 RepID=UPI000811A0E2|nr:PREDICTED: dynactin subunit 4 [Rhagoletis zephyria]XP_036319318.1 dynactin subunit 4 [Rhagoletis pomonella]
MANFMQKSVVTYACTCGLVNPITKLFFCRHCLKLRCGFCVCHEVDSHFCSNCLENIPSSEAKHKKNCCTNCFNCPCCQHTLSARATMVVVPKKSDEAPKESEGDGGKVVTKKMYYLSCLGCRWTSRDVGIPDQSVATGAWPENDCSYQTRFNALLEYYQAVVLQDKQEKQEYLRRKTPKAHKFPSLTDRTGLTVSMIRRQIGWPDKNTQKAKPVNISPSVATEELEELPDEVFTQPLNLRNVSNIKQRHGQPSDQPFTIDKLYPQRRILWIKRSLRCRQCEHNVIKPEYHPTSVKYRIQLFANYHVPDVLLVRTDQLLYAGKSSSITLKLTNPTMHDMSIKIKELPNHTQELDMIEEFKLACKIKETTATSAAAESLKSITSSPSLTSTTLSRQTSLIEDPRLVKEKTNAKLDTSEMTFVLNQRDDSTEFDEDVETPREEPEFIIWRKSNKASIRLNFTTDESLKVGELVKVGFTMEYTYVNTVTNAPTSHTLNARVFIDAGPIVAN